MLVDSSEAWTPAPAVAGPVSAGQLVAQSPLQADWSPLSLVKAYRVRPSPSTRMLPSVLLATATVVPPAFWAAVVVGPAGAAVAAVPDDSLLLLPPQAAAARVSAARNAAMANAFLITDLLGVAGRTWGRAERRPNRTTSSPGRWFPNPGSPESRRPRGPSSVAPASRRARPKGRICSCRRYDRGLNGWLHRFPPDRWVGGGCGRTRGDQPWGGRWPVVPADRGPAGAGTVDGVAGAGQQRGRGSRPEPGPGGPAGPRGRG